MSADGKTLIATTKLARFKAFLGSKGIELPVAGAAKARASANGHWARIHTDNFLGGHNYTVNSGFGVANMAAISGCNWFTCWNFENSVSSIQTSGRAALLYDLAELQPGLGARTTPPRTSSRTWPAFGFNDRLSSVYTTW